jgi:hypothetical protein
MTYLRLYGILDNMPYERLLDDVSILDKTVDEFMPISGSGVIEDGSEDSDVLDPGHFYLTIG